MVKDYKLTSDLYIIPYEEKGKNAFLAYFPLQSLIFEINRDAVTILNKAKVRTYRTENASEIKFLESLVELKVINGRKEPQPYSLFNDSPKPTYTMLLLTTKCQLKCIYCYGKSSGKGVMMSREIARKAVDTIVRNSIGKNTGLLHIGYHGGGEPTQNWEVLTDSYIYASEQCNTNDLRLYSSICTNGIFPKEKADWIIRNINDVAISMDGLPEVHNHNRPFRNGKGSFSAVSRTLDHFNKNNKKFNTRLTATEYSYMKLPETVKFLKERFNINMLSIEPLYVCGRCITSGCKPPSLDGFIKIMTEVIDLGKELCVNIQYSGNRLENLISRFCGAQGSNFFITPKGYVTACLEVSDYDDARADFFIYGRYDEEKQDFIFNNETYKKLASSQVQNFTTCRECFAKWHCAGDCIAKSPNLLKVTDERNQYRCRLNKTLLRRTLIDAMNQQINSAKPSAEVRPGILVS